MKLTLLLLSLACFNLHCAALIPIDDSYTVTERFVRNKQTHPEISWPTMTFKEGQQWMNDVLYRQIGERNLHLDVFLPVDTSSPRPAIMLIHGGGWRSGNKSHFYPMANKLAQRGYVVILPEYRLSAEAQYPEGLTDINYALAWVHEHANELHINSTQLALGGGSSGGQMATLIGSTGNTELYKSGLAGKNTAISAIIDLDGVLDFTTELALANENKNGSQSAAALWLGDSYEKMPERWQEASAASHISALTPPMLVISSGQSRFTAGKDEVFQQLEGFGIAHQYYEFNDMFHTFWLFDPYLQQSVKLIDQFLVANQQK